MEKFFLAVNITLLIGIFLEIRKSRVERQMMLQSIKNIELDTKELHKVLNPIEKRHFR